MKKRPTDPKTKAVVKKRIFYAVNNSNQDTVDREGIYLYDTIEEAYADHINDYGTNDPCYAYKIEFIGEVSMQLTIKP